MAERRWRRAALRDVPADVPPDDGVTADERETARADLREDESIHPVFPGYPPPEPRWHALRSFFGLTAFGVAASEAAAGEALIWPHTEATYGHEELYLVLEGRARFLFEGDGDVEVSRYELLFVEPDVGRGAIALETPTKLLMIGGTPGVYSVPIWSSDWRPPQWWLDARRAGS